MFPTPSDEPCLTLFRCSFQRMMDFEEPSIDELIQSDLNSEMNKILQQSNETTADVAAAATAAVNQLPPANLSSPEIFLYEGLPGK